MARPLNPGRPPWSPQEDRILAREWQQVGPRTLRAKLPGRTWLAIYCRTKHLGLPRGIPQGYESIKKAAARTGLDQPTLYKILTWAEVRIRPMYPSSRGRRREPREYVDPADVDDAVALWLRTESLEAASKRVGVSSKQLGRWLRAEGLLQRDGTRHTHRLFQEVTDRVVAARYHELKPKRRSPTKRPVPAQAPPGVSVHEAGGSHVADCVSAARRGTDAAGAEAAEAAPRVAAAVRRGEPDGGAGGAHVDDAGGRRGPQRRAHRRRQGADGAAGECG